MGHINIESINQYDKNIKDRQLKLEHLVSKPFDLQNREQMNTLKQFIDEFELYYHQLLIYQGMTEGLKIWGALKVLSFVIPVPEWISYFITAGFYIGASGFVIENFSKCEFNKSLSEMKTLYNWCLKDGKETEFQQDNLEKLADPQIQRMIQILAPVCSVDFMVTWTRETNNPVVQSGVLNMVGTMFSYGTSSMSYFFNAPKTEINLDRIKEIKKAVETREYDLNPYTGVDKAIRYFKASPYVKDLISESVKTPVELVKSVVPGYLLDTKKLN